MPSVQPRFGYPGSRVSYTASAAITGGRLVELTAARTVGPAGAGSTKCVGVAQWDVPASRASIEGPQVGDGNELVVLDDCFVTLVASGAIAAGDKLIAAAAGQASVAGATPDARTVVGTAIEAATNGNTFLAKVDC